MANEPEVAWSLGCKKAQEAKEPISFCAFLCLFAAQPPAALSGGLEPNPLAERNEKE
jgi:hypothetical protein